MTQLATSGIVITRDYELTYQDISTATVHTKEICQMQCKQQQNSNLYLWKWTNIF